MNSSLLLQFSRQDLIDRHASSSLGALWTVLVPLTQILIFTLIFSNVMGLKLQAMGMDDLGQYSYSVYLVTGLLAWFAFAGTVNRVSQVYQEKAGLISKVQLPLMTLPLYIPITETVIYLIGMSFFGIFLLLIDFQWHLTWLWWPVIYLVMQLLAYSIGLLAAILSVFIRDVRELVGLLMQVGFWLTPIVYVADLVPEAWRAVFSANPVYHLIEGLRSAMIMGETPALLPLAVITLGSLALLAATIRLGHRLERDMRDFI